MTAARYRKNPVVVEAVQWDGRSDNAAAIADEDETQVDLGDGMIVPLRELLEDDCG